MCRTYTQTPDMISEHAQRIRMGVRLDPDWIDLNKKSEAAGERGEWDAADACCEKMTNIFDRIMQEELALLPYEIRDQVMGRINEQEARARGAV